MSSLICWGVTSERSFGKGGIRPTLVISSDTFNPGRNGPHIVVPLTSQDRGLANHVKIEPPEGGLKNAALSMCEQEPSQSIERFRRLQGAVTVEALRSVQRTILEFIEASTLYQ